MSGSCSNMLRYVCVILSIILPPCHGYAYFREEVPNGNNVPHPCKPNYRWQGVGHLNPGGGGVRNVFGEAFDNAGYKWTYALCIADSDGDGLTNGQELGDPDCVWTPGKIPARTVNISHPGICDPYDSLQCAGKTDFVSCEVEGFEDCDAINNPEVQTLDLRFRTTQIPPTHTNYYCMTFDLPRDQDYHIIASEGIIDNANVLHHMLLYGCNDEDDLYIDPPAPCGMSATQCGTIIAAWTVGLAGQCFGSDIGYRIGKTAYKRVKLEFHYNNPQMLSTYTDSSGIRLYYQPAKPNVQDMFTYATGQVILKIPPGQSRVEHVGVCPSACTQELFNNTLYVVSAINHMHYLGHSMKLELYRAGMKVADLARDDFYSYDSPVNHVHDPPIKIEPGDEIKTTCVYNSLSKDRYTFQGDGTADEMCFGFLFMYPRNAIRELAWGCLSVGPLDQCSLDNQRPMYGCDWANFPDDKIYNDLAHDCNLDGFCRPECYEYLKTLKGHPCLTGEMTQVTKKFLQWGGVRGMEVLGRLMSCPWDKGTSNQGECPAHCTGTCWEDNYAHSQGHKMAATSGLLLISFMSFLRAVV